MKLELPSSSSTAEDQNTSYTDLLIVGAGPAGLTLAAWASRYGLKARIIDDKETQVHEGRADGLHPRTIEILDSFGIATPILKYGASIREICSWNPSDDDDSRIERTQRIRDMEMDLSRFAQGAIKQGYIERAFIDLLEDEGVLQVERNVITESVSHVDLQQQKHGEYAITLNVAHRNKSGSSGTETADVITENLADRSLDSDVRREQIHAKYLVGADGAHSWVRKHCGFELNKNRTQKHFGVMDIVPRTNFPDVRISCVIHSARHGSIMTLPREGRLIRCYVQLAETGGEEDRFDDKKVSFEDILTKAQKIISPYNLESGECQWWSIYTVDHQIAKTNSLHDRIFIVGDAVHAHTPTMGAGMNVSIQDSFNLGWKLAMVIKGLAKPQLLDTYRDERHRAAETLLDLDQEMSQFFVQGPCDNSKNYDEFRKKFTPFLSGTGVIYGPSVIRAEDDNDEQVNGDSGSPAKAGKSKFHSQKSLARNILTGQRLDSHIVVNQADASPRHIHDFMTSTGPWRIIIFAGDLTKTKQWERLESLARRLSDQNSIVCRHLRPNEPKEAAVEIFTIHSAPRVEIELLDLPEVLRPYHETLGYDYWKVFASETSIKEREGDPEDAYSRYGIDAQHGCVVICRPDQHVSLVCDMEDVDMIDEFFEQVLVSS
ncbi:phenol 2-monooxygenase [Exophiala viscosa]|uniref:phenol 2-monooxygenase n=1 Tax=Exophiala viscosa TaxID=2486360 RepID=UPI00219488B5|nr:phenol 2-monooxygenase [Exophiala viscosa]